MRSFTQYYYIAQAKAISWAFLCVTQPLQAQCNHTNSWVSFCIMNVKLNTKSEYNPILLNKTMGILILSYYQCSIIFHIVSRLHMHKKHHSCTKTHLESSNKEHLCDALVDKWGQGIVLMNFLHQINFKAWLICMVYKDFHIGKTHYVRLCIYRRTASLSLSFLFLRS